MRASNNQEANRRDDAEGTEDNSERQLGGSGAASALERMKAERALRHKRQHGHRGNGPGHEDDPTPQR